MIEIVFPGVVALSRDLCSRASSRSTATAESSGTTAHGRASGHPLQTKSGTRGSSSARRDVTLTSDSPGALEDSAFEPLSLARTHRRSGFQFKARLAALLVGRMGSSISSAVHKPLAVLTAVPLAKAISITSEYITLYRGSWLIGEDEAACLLDGPTAKVLMASTCFCPRGAGEPQ